jgi:lipid-binding SYLF domain-containing protein
MKINKKLILGTITAIVALSGCTSTGMGASSAPMSDAEKQSKRDAIVKMRDDTLEQLYAQKPAAREELQKSVGYGVFEASQINAVMVLESYGDGLLTDNQSHAQTFMKMDRLGTGPGVGYKSYRQVVIFKSKALFDKFHTIGADVSASADATVKIGGTGGSAIDNNLSFNPYLSVYQFTDTGVILQANWGGVAFRPYTELNEPAAK